MRWWHELSEHFEEVNGLPLPESMLRQAEHELRRMCPGSLTSAVAKVIASADLMQELVDSLGMGLTWFFREERGLYKLIEAYRRQERETGRRSMWVWSAGCSTGQEPYSIAIALKEAGAEPMVLGTDLNREHLRLAREGRYAVDRLGSMHTAIREKYFDVESKGVLRAKAEIRNCVQYEMHNFATSEGAPFGCQPFDAILCRNALIYYKVREARRIADSLRTALRRGGTMIVGSVEESMLRESSIRPVAYRKPVRAHEPRREEPAPPPTDEPSWRGVPRADPVRRSEALLTEKLMKAASLRAAGQTRESTAMTLQTVQNFPLSGGAQLAHGMNLMTEKREEEAVDALRAARFLDSTGWLATYNLGLCLESLGHKQEAQQSFRDTLKLIRQGMLPTAYPIPGIDAQAQSVHDVVHDCKRRLPFLDKES